MEPDAIRTCLSIRRARPADVGAIHALVELCYRGHPRERAWTSEVALVGGPRTSPEEIRRVVDGPDSFMLVAETNGSMVGCCQVESRSDEDAYFGMFAVHPASQNLGVGRALLRAAEAHAVNDFGARRMVMQVISRRSELLEWYDRLGYRETGEVLPFASHDDTVALRPGLTFTVLARNLDAM